MGDRFKAIGGDGTTGAFVRLLMLMLTAVSAALVALLTWNASTAFTKLDILDTAVTSFMAQSTTKQTENERQFGGIDARLSRHTERLDRLDHDVTTLQAQMPVRAR